MGNPVGHVTLGGEEYDLYLPIPALNEFEKLTGVPYQKMDDGSSLQLTAMLYVAIKHGKPSGSRFPSIDKVAEMLTDSDIFAVSKELGETLIDSIPAFRKAVDEDGGGKKSS